MNTPAEFQAHYAEQRGREAIAQAKKTLEDAWQELDRYAIRDTTAESIKDKADVLNWTLGYLASNITPNLRLDLIAAAQAELARTESMQ